MMESETLMDYNEKNVFNKITDRAEPLFCVLNELECV